MANAAEDRAMRRAITQETEDATAAAGYYLDGKFVELRPSKIVATRFTPSHIPPVPADTHPIAHLGALKIR